MASPTTDQLKDLILTDRSWTGVRPIIKNTNAAPGRGLAVNATTGGTVRVRFADDSIFDFSVVTGLSALPFAVKTVLSDGTTADATFFHLV